MLSYRHAYHAGSHADVLKHCVVLELLSYFNRKDKPWHYIDTHAGGGCYALESERAGKTAEHEEGIARIWGRTDLPAPLAAYREAVAQFNPHGRLVFYPGSPALAMTMARPQDRLRLFELHPADFEALERTFAGETERVQCRKADGFTGLKSLLPPLSRRALVLIDPSYEIKDDYRKVVWRAVPAHTAWRCRRSGSRSISGARPRHPKARGSRALASPRPASGPE